MVIKETALAGAFVLEPERRNDSRGFFARTFCKKEFQGKGLLQDFVQCNTSFNSRRGTLRGMHYQEAPYPEVKLVRCTRGAVYDVIVDLRPASPTFRRWVGVQLTEENGASLYVPEGMAHGFQTLVDNSEVFYQMGEYYYPELARGVRWNDTAFAIEWPLENPSLSEKDANYPDVD